MMKLITQGLLLLCCLAEAKAQPAGKLKGIKLSTHPDTVKIYKYREKIDFIQQAASFIRNELSLLIGEDFYTTFQQEDKPLNYVYFSLADSVYCPQTGTYPFRSFGTNEYAASECVREYAKEGMHTLLYQTAGTSSTQLNSQLLDYDYEAISFIVFHEAMHKHLANSQLNISYEFVEALCDVFGNYGPDYAAAALKKINKKKIEKQVKVNEQILEVINYYHTILNETGDLPFRDSVFSACQREIARLLKKGDKFQNERFRHTVNNAYFVRWYDYAHHYFFLKELYLNQSANGFFNSLLWLSMNKNSGKNQIIENQLKKSSPPLPFDVIAVERDDNGFPKNPVWGYQHLYGNDSLPGKEKMRLSDDYIEWYSGAMPCTHNQLFRDPNTFPGCGLAHINWFPVTYECNVYWKDHAFDDDYNFKLKREDKALYTEDNPTWVYAEFDSDETVDRWRKNLKKQSARHFDFWDYLHLQVDSCDSTAGRSFNGKEAIVSGLLGLDCSHSGETELHPVYLMAIHIKEDSIDDTWAFFARNWGNLGWCGTSQHYLQTRVLKLRLPRRGVKSLYYNEKTKINSSVMNPVISTAIIPDSGAIISFNLPPPGQHGWIEGELHINWNENNPPEETPKSHVERINNAIFIQKEPAPLPYPAPHTALGKGKILLFFKRVW